MSLRKAVYGRFGLNQAGLASFNSNTAGFTQIRFRCTKTTHSRVFDVATKSTEALQYFTDVSSTLPKACGSYYTLEEDSSITAQYCERYKDGTLHGTGVGNRLTQYPFSIPDERGNNIENGKRECDDLSSSGEISYKIYVR